MSLLPLASDTIMLNSSTPLISLKGHHNWYQPILLNFPVI